MPNVTKEMASFENEQVRFFIRYDDGSGFANRISCTNALPYTCYGEITEPATGTQYGRIFQPGSAFAQLPNNLFRVRFVPDPEFPDLEVFEIWHPTNLTWIKPQTHFRAPA